jgi:hypothetical protein
MSIQAVKKVVGLKDTTPFLKKQSLFKKTS